MTYWFDMPQVLDDEAYEKECSRLLDLTEKHLSKAFAVNMRAMREEFIEWRGEGCYIYDARGKAFYDAVGAGGVFALGHAHPKITAALRKQLDRGGLTCRNGISPGQLELLDRLSKITPGNMQYGYIGNTGTEVMEAAMKLARLVTGRPEIIAMHMGYHGMTIATLSITGLTYWKEGIGPLLPECRLISYNNIAAARLAITDKTAAVVLEPVQWGSGCQIADTHYLQQLRELCDKHGTLLIFDEMQSGLGRTGDWFAANISGVVPDMIAMGKTLSGGMMPIAALMYNDRVQAACDKRPLFNNSTFAGNQLATATALAALDIVEEDHLLDRVRHLGNLLEKEFASLIEELPEVYKSQSGTGLMRCLFTAHPQFGFMIAMLLTKEHHLMLPSMAHSPQVLRASPAFIAKDEDMRMIGEALRETGKKVRDMGVEGIGKYMAEITEKLKKAQENSQNKQ